MNQIQNEIEWAKTQITLEKASHNKFSEKLWRDQLAKLLKLAAKRETRSIPNYGSDSSLKLDRDLDLGNVVVWFTIKGSDSENEEQLDWAETKDLINDLLVHFDKTTGDLA